MKTKTTYELRRISNPSEAAYLEGLSIYATETHPGEKTSTNEISYWLQRYNKKFDDTFFVFVFLKDGSTIGYTQFVYFKSSRLLYFDYLTIKQEFRGGNTFFEFFAQIRQYIMQVEGLDIDYILTDITYRTHNNIPSSFTILFVRLLKIYGFGVIKFSYIAPMLGYANHESEMTSVFMIHSKDLTKALRPETYKEFVRTIYYDHYIRWYEPFLAEPLMKEYEGHIGSLFQKMILNLEKKKLVEVNGHMENIIENAQSIGNQASPKQILLFGLIFIMLFFLVGAILFVLKKYLDISETLVWVIFIFSMISFVTISAIFSSKSRQLLTSLLDKFLP